MRPGDVVGPGRPVGNAEPVDADAIVEPGASRVRQRPAIPFGPADDQRLGHHCYRIDTLDSGPERQALGHDRIYRHFCMTARALEVIGERWSLLIVRDLLLGP